jgi:ribosome maturation factor RimP
MSDELEAAVAQVLDQLGYDLVVLERGGGRRRPLLRLRVERPGDEPGKSTLTADNCAEVSRAVMEMLEERDGPDTDYVLEVSSPGIERPLVRAADYSRFAGQQVRVRGFSSIVGGRKQVDGVLLGLDQDDEGVLLEVDGERVTVPMAAIARANLRYSFDGE